MRRLRTLRGRVQLLVAGLLMLLLVGALGTLLVQLQVSATEAKLRGTLRPAQVEVAMLTEAFTDQQLGERVYLLTGDPALLQAYTAGRSAAARLQARLAAELAGDPESIRYLAEIKQAAAAWQAQVSEPEIAARAHGPLPAKTVLRDALTGQQLTAALREGLVDLGTRVNQLAAAEIEHVNTAQRIDNWLTVASGALALALAVVSVFVLRKWLVRPLTVLVGQVRRVADGDLDHSVDPTGPEELAAVGQAVERMRVRILKQTAQASQMQRQLDLTAESERIAAGLQDVVIRRLSEAGLALQSAAVRYPAAAHALGAAVGEIDIAIRELRTIIFGLTTERAGAGPRGRVLDLVAQRERDLPFTPRLQFSGTDGMQVSTVIADELVAALSQILSDIAASGDATETDIMLSLSERTLLLQVAEDGGRPAAEWSNGGRLAAVRERAGRLGGTCTISSTSGGTTINWQVPLSGADHQVV